MTHRRLHAASRVIRACVCGLLVCSAAPAARAASVGVNRHGVHIDGGNMGTFGLPAPSVFVGSEERKPIEKRLNGGVLRVKYAGGISLDMKHEGGGKISYRFSGNTAGIKSFRISDFHIPFNYTGGGTWKIGGGAVTPFPARKPAKPFLFQGNASSFEFSSIDGKRIKITVPDHTYHQIQDNREWGWKIFGWWCQVPFNRGWPAHYISVEIDASAAKDVKLVDRFGQSTRKTFPGKITSARELQADVETEKAYYASLDPLPVDAWGGLPGSGSRLGLKRTGFFHVEKKRRRWVLVDPAGNAFFHLGICSFGFTEDYTYIEGRESAYEWLPPHDATYTDAWNPEKYWNPRAVSFHKANVIRKYGEFDNEGWMRRMVDRIRRMGFNSIGAFSGSRAFKEKKIPYVGHLPLGQWNLGKHVPGVRGVFDPFDADVLRKMDEQFARNIARESDEPLMIGYFLENEQALEDIPRAVPKLDGTHACKRRLVRMLRDKYRSVSAFNSAWKADAPSFDALENRGLPLVTKASFNDMHDYMGLFLEEYYKVIVDTFRKYDKNHMLIGNRWQPGTANNETLCRVAGKYMDVISVNYYTDSIDEAFIRRIHTWTGGKPQMWSEFNYTSEKESNVAGGGLDLDTQRLRGQAYRQYVEGAAALGFVVGVEWFTLIDQAVTGRFFERYNGERGNTGIFNVLDRPYKPLAAEMLKAHKAVYDVWLNGKAPFVSDNPRFALKGNKKSEVSAGHAKGAMAVDGQLTGWPTRPPTRIGADRLVTGRENYGVEASFKLAWDERNLYLMVNVVDPTPMMNKHSGGNLWNADAIELFIGSEKLGQGGGFLFTDRQILIGAGKAGQFYVANAAMQPSIVTSVLPSVDGTGYTLEASIPWSGLSVRPKAGLELLFDIAIDDSDTGTGRRCQLMWNGIARNSSDRGAWGRVRLVP